MCIRDRDSYAYHGGMDGHPGVSCMVFQTAGSNATEVNQNIDKLLEEASKDLPKGVEPVSYTHLDVYKRQLFHGAKECKAD